MLGHEPLTRSDLSRAASTMKNHTRFHGRITIDAEILLGKPVVTGTRIPVELVLEKLARNPDLNELFADYPRLTREDVQACLEYAGSLVRHTPFPTAKEELVAQRRGG